MPSQAKIKFGLLKQQYIDAAVDNKIDGEIFSDRIWSNKSAVANQVRLGIQDALNGDVTIDKLGKQIQEAFNVQAYQSMRLVNTENTRVQSQAIDDIAKNTGVNQQMFCATLENNTCDECAALDGKYYNIDDDSKPAIPLHPNCRCTYINVPFAGWQPVQRKDNQSGSIIDYQDYNTWAEKNGIISSENVLPKFELSDNVKAAARYAIDNDLSDKADYTGIDIDTANQWNQSIFETLQKYPELRSNMQFTGSIQNRNKEYINQRLPDTVQMVKNLFPNWDDKKVHDQAVKTIRKSIGRTNSNVIAESMSKSTYKINGICINTKYGKNFQALTDELKKNVSSGWSPQGCDAVKATVDHELGHQIDHLLGIRDNTELRDLFFNHNDEVRNGLSRYGATKIGEMVAEGYSEFVNNPNPRPIAQKIGNIIKEAYSVWKSRK